MIGIFTVYPQDDLGLIVLRTGKNIFRRGTRVAVMGLDATHSYLKAGLLPAVNQLEALNVHLREFFDNERVFALCGGPSSLDHYVLWLGHCQWLGCDKKHFVPFPISNNGAVCVCRSCENKLNIQETPRQFEEIARQNRAAWILNSICDSLGLPKTRQLGKWEIVGWCIENNLQSLLTRGFLYQLTKTEANPSTGRECDIAPSYDPEDEFNKRISVINEVIND